jgi:hypothetical protein
MTGLDDRNKMAGILCDLSKAFDVICHKLLLNKLESYGITNKAHHLFTSFLSERKQVVKLPAHGKMVQSDTGYINLGIPQGSALGNTLFLLFMNDLPSNIVAGLSVLFADDTTVIVGANTYEQLNLNIHEACRQLQTWFSANGLLLNVAKSHIMLFSGRKVPIPPSITSCSMPLCEESRFLGFIIDSNLNWKRHVDSLSGRLSSAVFALRKLKPLISSDALKQVYFAHFHSLMSYGSLLWGNSTDAQRVFILQKRAVRILVGVKNRHSCRELFSTQRILTHYSQHMFDLLLFVKKNISQFARVNVTGKQLRSTGRLRTVPRRMALSRKNPRVIGPTYFEHLPADLRNEPCDETFGRGLRNLLLDNPLYSINEFMDIVFI